MLAPGAMEVPGTAAHSHPQPATNTPVPSPSTFLAAVQQRLLVWLLLTSPLPFGAQDPPEHPPPRETSPFTTQCYNWDRAPGNPQPPSQAWV